MLNQLTDDDSKIAEYRQELFTQNNNLDGKNNVRTESALADGKNNKANKQRTQNI